MTSRRLRKLSRRLDRGMARLVAGLIQTLPSSTVARVLEHLDPEVRLDHPALDVRLGAASFLARARARACAKEPETVAWLESELCQGDVFYDIGANVGAYSLLAAALEPTATVYSFEPIAENYAVLCSNVRRNHLERRVTPVPLAIADRTGTCELTLSDPRPGAALHTFSDGQDGPAQRALLESLDDAIEHFRLPPPDLLKIDVDGAESAVLDGATRLLQDRRLRSVLVEIDRTKREDEAIVRALESAGLHVRSRHPRGVSVFSNVIFTRQETASEREGGRGVA